MFNVKIVYANAASKRVGVIMSLRALNCEHELSDFLFSCLFLAECLKGFFK